MSSPAHTDLPDWPGALGTPPHGGRFREAPEDFRVEEVMPFEPEGEGEHLWLECEKRALSTPQLVRHLSRCFEVAPRDIGVSGLKDHTAITRQWLSVSLAGRPAPADPAALIETAGVRLLRWRRHPRKLKRGVHRANRFSLVVRGEAVAAGSLAARFAKLCAGGVPNYFGPQRFGHGGSNIARARALLAQGWRKKRDRDGLLLSSARSLVFNNLLAERIADGSWCHGLAGDIFKLAGSASHFAAEALDDELRQRLAALDIHPTGPLWGAGSPESDGDAAALERQVAQREAELASGIEAAGARPARRALRFALADTAVETADDVARLRFELPRGSFATAVLRELIAAPGL